MVLGASTGAYDPTIGRIVAIKVLSVGDDPSVLSRFRIEAAAAGKLHHKNIVTIHDFGEHKGVPFLVMEFLEGEELQKTIAHRRTLSRIEQLHTYIISQIAEGLRCAHKNGVVHRDIKPANIMLQPGDVKIMDFGIARIADPDATRQTKTSAQSCYKEVKGHTERKAKMPGPRCGIKVGGIRTAPSSLALGSTLPAVAGRA